MGAQREVELTDEQVSELMGIRDHHPLAYVRERAAAILKVAGGEPVRQVALMGLLKSRRAETVGEWINRYLAEGPSGLRVREGRGRKPAFSPSASDQPGSAR
jgi:transposase